MYFTSKQFMSAKIADYFYNIAILSILFPHVIDKNKKTT